MGLLDGKVAFVAANAMIQNEALYRAFRPDLAQPGLEDVKAGFAKMNLLPIPLKC